MIYFNNILGFFCKIGTKIYDDLSYLELKPSDHHGPISADKLVSKIEWSGFIIKDKK